METVKVFSPVDDKDIRQNLNGSPIWKLAYTESELKEAEKKHPVLFEYSVKFDGVKPVQLLGVKKLTK
jgi:hypothetical protein